MRRALLLPLALLTLAACVDDPAVRDRLGLDENGLPLPGASPSPSALATATPSPTPVAEPTATPGASGRYVRTFDPLDVAISGPGYFVASTTLTPDSFEDLLFTRRGNFELRFVPEGSPAPGADPYAGPGRWRLVTPEGLYVLGFDFAGPEGAEPAEGVGSEFHSAFTLGLSGPTALVAGPLTIDAQANANLRPGFNFKGQLLDAERPPVGPDGEPRYLYLAVVQFENPAALEPRAGLHANLYRPEAGSARVGIAGLHGGEAAIHRPVGEANLILPETLEL